MTVDAVLPVPVVLPICGAIAAPLLARVHRRLPLVVGLVSLAGALAVLGVIAATVYAGSGQVVSHFLSAERPVDGKALGISLAADPFGVTFALLTAGLGLVLLLSALSELGDIGPRELGGLTCLLLLLLAALIGAALTADGVNLFVWFEVAGLASYGLTGFFLEQPTAVEAAFKVVVLTSIAGFVIFAGVAMLYTTDGALNLGQLHHDLPPALRSVEVVALALVLCGFATKAGVVPFHTWLPDAHAMVPGAVSAAFSGLMVCLGVVGIVRMSLLVFGPGTPQLLGLLTVLGLTTAILGALMALAQDDLKRLLAWDTASQMGILVVGFASATPEGVTGAVYHLVNHGLFKALLFLCAGAVLHSTGLVKLSELGGLARRQPLITAAFTVGALAIAGVPPLNGFASLGLIHAGLEHEPAVFVLALVAQVITVAALGRAAYLGFYRRRSEPYEHLERQHLGMRVSLIVLAVGCAAFGVLPRLVISHVASPAASLLLHPEVYAAGVLSGSAAVPSVAVAFDYAGTRDLVMAGVELVLGLAVAAAYIRFGEPRAVSWLRRVHTGSVNDYAAAAAGGVVLVSAVLLL
jgi:multicomponent Na+:H+ antiporter subunit D